MLEGTSAVGGDDTVGALVILGGLTDSALLGGGATSVDLGSDEDDGDDGESRMRLRARRQRRELRSGMHLTNLADSHLSLLPDVWRIGVGGPSGSVIGSWQRLEWRHSITGEQPARRYGHSAAVLPSGDIFMFGGVVHAVFSAGEKDKDGSSSSSSSSKSKGRNVLPTRASADAWLLRGARSGRGSWHRVERKNGASWPPARAFHTCTAVSDALLLVGGRGEDGEGLADMWVYRDGLWEQMPPVGGAYNPVIAPVFARVGQSAVTLPLSTRVLTFGGVDGNNELLDLVSLYNPPVCSASVKEEWSQAAAACVDCPSGTQAVPIVSEKKRIVPAPSPPAPPPSSPMANATRNLLNTTNSIAIANQSSSSSNNEENEEGAFVTTITTVTSTVCVLCPAGWLSSVAGATVCVPCPRGTFARSAGSSSWAACELCPIGTYASEPGSRECTPCEAEWTERNGKSDAQALCPVGSAAPSALHTSLQSRELAERLSLTNWPDAQSELYIRQSAMQRFQVIIGVFGVFAYVVVLLFLAITALVRPAIAESLLRSLDVPPISGGQGNSLPGGFVTITFIFTYTSFFLTLSQFLYFNGQMDVSMLQVSSKHFETTSANYRIDLTLIGLQAEHCTAAAANARLGPIAASDIYDEHPLFPYNSNISSGPLSTRGLCAEGVSILSTGLVGLQGVHNSSGVPSVSCGLIDTDGSDYYPHEHQQEVRSLDDAAACAVTIECVECMVNAANAFAELELEIQGRFAMAHGISWEARIEWTKYGSIPGSSWLSGIIPAPKGRVLRGEEPSVISLGLLPTVYQDFLNKTNSLGYRLQYESTTAGDLASRESFHHAKAGAEQPDSLKVRLRLKPTTQQFTMTVQFRQTWLEFISTIVSLGSGMAFISRLSLWFYLRFAHVHASRLGKSVKASYKDLHEALLDREKRLRELGFRQQSAPIVSKGVNKWINRAHANAPSTTGAGSSSDTEMEGVGTATAVPRAYVRRKNEEANQRLNQSTNSVVDTALRFLDYAQGVLDRGTASGSDLNSPYDRLHDEDDPNERRALMRRRSSRHGSRQESRLLRRTRRRQSPCRIRYCSGSARSRWAAVLAAAAASRLPQRARGAVQWVAAGTSTHSLAGATRLWRAGAASTAPTHGVRTRVQPSLRSCAHSYVMPRRVRDGRRPERPQAHLPQSRGRDRMGLRHRLRQLMCRRRRLPTRLQCRVPLRLLDATQTRCVGHPSRR